VFMEKKVDLKKTMAFILKQYKNNLGQ